MDLDQQTANAVDATGVLAGARAWLITGGGMGMLTQAKAVADALGVDSVVKTVRPPAPWRHMAPWGPVSPSERFGLPKSAFAPPWPELAIAVGRASIPYIRRLRREAGRVCYTVVLQDPRTGPDTADLIWVPTHDLRRGPKVITTMISPHGFSPGYLSTLRRHSAPAIDVLPTPRVAVIVGGRTRAYQYTEADHVRLSSALRSIAGLGVSLLITTLPRTHPELLASVEAATRDAPRILWTGEGDGPNPYADFMARADYFVVTADSINKIGEASASGRPIYVFHPSGGSAKFTRFHRALEKVGAARPLPETLCELQPWTYEPQVSADLIAAEIERRYLIRSQQIFDAGSGHGAE